MWRYLKDPQKYEKEIDAVLQFHADKGKTLIEKMKADDETAGQMFKPPRPSAESEFVTMGALESQGYVTQIFRASKDSATRKAGQAIFDICGLSGMTKDSTALVSSY